MRLKLTDRLHKRASDQAGKRLADLIVYQLMLHALHSATRRSDLKKSRHRAVQAQAARAGEPALARVSVVLQTLHT